MDRMTRQSLPFATLILIVLVLYALEPDTFFTPENLSNVLRRSSVNGIIAVGMTAVIISAGIDLSVGSMMALCGMVGAWSMIAIGGPHPEGNALLAGTLVGIAAGFVCGLLNGVAITKLKLPPFIVTLGTMSIFRGVSLVMNNSNPFDLPAYTHLFSGGFLGIPVPVLICAAVLAMGGFLLKYSRLGRHTYAIGSNRQAAFHAGINIDRSLIWVYALTGLAVGIAAMITTSRTVSAQPTAGVTLELDIIAAVVIGGTSLAGGRGTIVGTIVGTLLISFLRNGCNLLGINTNYQLIVIGAVIIAAAALDQLVRSKAESAG